MPWDVVEETVTIERWQAYEEEWGDISFVDDMVSHFLGFNKKDAGGQEVPMTREEYRRRYGH